MEKFLMNANWMKYGFLGIIAIAAVIFLGTLTGAHAQNGTPPADCVDSDKDGKDDITGTACAAATPDPNAATGSTSGSTTSTDPSWPSGNPGDKSYPSGSENTLVLMQNQIAAKKDETKSVHAFVPDWTKDSAVITLSDNTTLSSAENTSKEPLTVTQDATTKVWMVTTMNGAPLGTAVILNLKATADGYVGTTYEYAESTSLVGPSFTSYARHVTGTTYEHATQWFTYLVNDPQATTATLTVLPGTELKLDASCAYGINNACRALSSSVDNGVMTIKTVDGLPLGTQLELTFTSSDTHNPFGVK